MIGLADPLLRLTCAFFLQTPATSTFTQADLQSHVERVLRSGKMTLPKPTFDWSGDELIYKLPPTLKADADRDPYEAAVAEQLLVESIRKYRLGSRGQRKFWGPVLDEVERQIDGMLQDIATIQDAQRRTQAVDSRTESIQQIYATSLDRLARANGKQRARTQAEAALYSVEVQIAPAGGTLKYMTAGPWLLYMIRNNGREPGWDNQQWVTAVPGGPIKVGEMTRFWARWQTGRGIAETIRVEGKPQGALVADRANGFRWLRKEGNDQ